MSPTKFASLHGGLLARKGQAAPAVPSPQSYVVYTDNPPPEPREGRLENCIGEREAEHQNAPHEFRQTALEIAVPVRSFTPPPREAPPLRQTPAEPQQPQVKDISPRRLEQELEIAFPHSSRPADSPASPKACDCRPPPAKPAPDHQPPGDTAKRKYQVRLRINAEQRRRLRTAAAQFGVSNQQILSDALAAYLDQLGLSELKNCACLSRQSGPVPSQCHGPS